MSKGVKLGLVLLVLLILVAGGAYGLARLGIIPVQKMAKKNPAMRAVLKLAGIKMPVEKPAPRAAAPDPLAGEKLDLVKQQAALADERAAWEAQKQAQLKAEASAKEAAQSAIPDPKELAR